MTTWTEDELRAIEEAKIKLRRSARANRVIGTLGLVGTLATFAIMTSGGILFYGAVVAGPLRALDATIKLRRLDALSPGTPLSAKVLGVATSIDPPRTTNRTAVTVLAVLIAGLLAFIVLALMLG